MRPEDIKLQYYTGGIKSNRPQGKITLLDWIKRHKNPQTRHQRHVDAIKAAGAKGMTARKQMLKNKLVFVTPSIIVKTRRRYEDIEYFTGLAQIDFDGEIDVPKLKDYLKITYPFFYTLYSSPSGGLKGLMRIPICKSVDEFQDYYRAIQEEFEQIDGFDPAPKNAVLPLFASYDFFTYFNPTPKTWSRKKPKEKSFHEQYPLPPRPYTLTAQNKKNERRALNTAQKVINGITDNGHPQLRSACLVLGTRVGAGYVTREGAITHVEWLIHSHPYLRKGIKGYCTTAKWAIDEGLKTPKYY